MWAHLFYHQRSHRHFLFAQLENLDKIQNKRKKLWQVYNTGLKKLAKTGKITLPLIPDFATNNAHMYYIICSSLDERTELIRYLKANDIYTVFHYLSLHKSPYYLDKYTGNDLPNTDKYSDCLLRLPMYYELKTKEAKFVCEKITAFYEKSL